MGDKYKYPGVAHSKILHLPTCLDDGKCFRAFEFRLVLSLATSLAVATTFILILTTTKKYPPSNTLKMSTMS